MHWCGAARALARALSLKPARAWMVCGRALRTETSERARDDRARQPALLSPCLPERHARLRRPAYPSSAWAWAILRLDVGEEGTEAQGREGEGVGVPGVKSGKRLCVESEASEEGGEDTWKVVEGFVCAYTATNTRAASEREELRGGRNKVGQGWQSRRADNSNQLKACQAVAASRLCARIREEVLRRGRDGSHEAVASTARHAAAERRRA
eukprot:2844916-Pleurochrysis_carterae.AAC.2